MRGSRGFLLVSVLLITLILLTLGLTFLGKRAIQYRRIALFEQSAVAQALAESGLEDALSKMRRDIEFPPLARDQSAFSYTEPVAVDGARIGTYTVTLDGSRRFTPHFIWTITSQGKAGSNPASPSAQRSFRAELDVARHRRDDGILHAPEEGPTNTYFYRVVNFQDLGGL